VVLAFRELGLFCGKRGDLWSALDNCRGHSTSVEGVRRRFGDTAGEEAKG